MARPIPPPAPVITAVLYDINPPVRSVQQKRPISVNAAQSYVRSVFHAAVTKLRIDVNRAGLVRPFKAYKHSCGVARDDTVWRHVRPYHRSGRHHAAFTDANAGKDEAPSPNPDAVSDYDRPHIV